MAGCAHREKRESHAAPDCSSSRNPRVGRRKLSFRGEGKKKRYSLRDTLFRGRKGEETQWQRGKKVALEKWDRLLRLLPNLLKKKKEKKRTRPSSIRPQEVCSVPAGRKKKEKKGPVQPHKEGGKKNADPSK